MATVHEPGRVQQVCEALVTLLEAFDHTGISYSDDIAPTRTYSILSDLAEVSDTVVTVIAPQFTKRVRDSNATYIRYVVVDIVVRIHLTSGAGEDLATTDNRVYLLEQIDKYLASPANHDLTLPDGKLAQYVEPTDTRADSDIREGLGVLWESDDLIDKRQVTGLVRVAYWVDEDY